jgi:hypothetical protein
LKIIAAIPNASSPLEALTEADVVKALSAASLRKAYALRNKVFEPTRTDSTLRAQVRGGALYNVEIDVTDRGIVANCDCAYDWGGYCKHVGAVLLKWLDAPTLFRAVSLPNAATIAVGGEQLEVVKVEPPVTTRPSTLPAWIDQPQAARHQAEREQLALTLNQLRLEDLRALAQRRSWTLRGTRKGDVIDQLIGYLTDPQAVQRALETLDDEHRAVLRAAGLVSTFPAIEPALIERVAEIWIALKRFKEVGRYLNHLSELGLIQNYYLGQRVHGIPYATILRPVARHTPPLLAEVLPTLAELPPALPTAGLHLADQEQLARTALQVLLLFEQFPTPLRPPTPRPRLAQWYQNIAGWEYLPEELLPLQKKGRSRNSYEEQSFTVPPPPSALPAEAIARLTPLTGDAARLEFLYHLLVGAGLLQSGSPVTVWPEVKERFLRLDPAMQQGVLARTYFGLSSWSELWDLLRTQPTLRLVRTWSTYGYGPTMETFQRDLVNLRQMLLGVCAWLPDGQWIKVSDLLALLEQIWLQFDGSFFAAQVYHPTGRAPWALTKQGKPLQKQKHDDWQLAQGNFVLTLLRGPLTWLGLVDLYSERETPLYVRFRGLADLFWDRSEAVAQSGLTAGLTALTPPRQGVQSPNGKPTSVIVTGNTLRIQAAQASTAAHALLDRIGRLSKVEAQEFVYELDVTAVHQAFEQGAALDDLIGGWQANFGAAMPEHIQQQLTRWWAGYGGVRLYRDVSVIEFGDDYALTEMKAVTSLGQLLVAEISPRLVLIPKTAIKQLQQELEKAGYTPQVAGE